MGKSKLLQHISILSYHSTRKKKSLEGESRDPFEACPGKRTILRLFARGGLQAGLQMGKVDIGLALVVGLVVVLLGLGCRGEGFYAA